MKLAQSITPSTKLLGYDRRKFKTVTLGEPHCWVSVAPLGHVVPPCGDERRYMVKVSVGPTVEHCVVQVSLTTGNQDSFFQRIKASEKSLGAP